MGKINFIGGARMEQTSTEYSSWEGNVEDAEDAEYDNIPKTLDSFFVAQKVSKEYTNVLPMAHIRYSMNDRTMVRAAYTETIARADFAALVPFIA
jgi:outer membrane receptor protein involved in Fe transport